MDRRALVLLAVAGCATGRISDDELREYMSRHGAEGNLSFYLGDGRRACPYCALAVSCGDGVCDRKNGENDDNCFEDCSAGLVRSYNHQTVCSWTSELRTPKDEAEVQNLVRTARSERKHLKIIGNRHSDNEGLCTDGITLSSHKLDHIFGIEMFDGVETVRVETGATIFQVNEYLHDRQRSLGFGVPSYRSVTIGGTLANAVHGSAPHDTSILASLVVSARVVLADGSVREFTAADGDAFKALKVSLGLLGVITEVRLKTRPQFNLEVTTTYHDADSLRDLHHLYQDCDWVQIHWFPSAKQVMRSCGKITAEPAMPGATNALIGEEGAGYLLRMTKRLLQYGAGHPWAAAFVESARWSRFKQYPPFRAGGKAAHRVVGPSHRMQGSEYLSAEARSLRTRDFELAFPRSQMIPALTASAEYFAKHKIALPLVGLFIRFSRVDDESLLSLASTGGEFVAGEPAMYTEFTYYKPAGLREAEMARYEAVYADWVRLMIRDYHARVHWAKNKPFAFVLSREAGNLQDRLQRFQRVIDQLDPDGLFRNKFGEEIGFHYGQ
jgi:FAD/FMN-containing dehydrogenase